MPSTLKLSRLAKTIGLLTLRHHPSYSYHLKNMMKLATIFIVLSIPIMLEINSWIGILFLGAGILLAAHIATLRKAEREALLSPEYQDQMKAYLNGNSDILSRSPMESRRREL